MTVDKILQSSDSDGESSGFNDKLSPQPGAFPGAGGKNLSLGSGLFNASN